MGVQDAYVSGSATALYGGHFARAADRRAAVLRAVRPLAPRVADALEAQAARLPPSPERARSLQRLRTGAAVVVTGQQVGLLLGPLYTLFKAASAVRVAQALAEETGAPVVPVFWLQSEDHDLVEVATTHAPGRHGTPLQLRVPVAADNRVSVAHCALPPEVEGCLRELRELLGGLPHAEEHLALLAAHYRAGAPWVGAFAGVLATLFAHTGLVLVDPRDPALASLCAPVHAHALREAGPLSRALLERCALLQSQGFTPSIHVREGAPLSFFHPEGPAGPRYRLEPCAGGGLAAVGAEGPVHAPDALLRALEAEPRAFSTSALLRPVLQDTLLPTAAYVGGPGEVAYFAQLAPLYAGFGMQLPLVVPRARFRVVDARAERLLQRLALTSAEALQPADALLARRSGAREAAARAAQALQARALAGLDAALAQGRTEMPEGLAGLERAMDHTRHKVRHALERLQRRAERAALHADTALVEDVRRLQALLLPEGQPMERFYGPSAWAAQVGGRALVDATLAAATPWETTQLELRP